jgi:DNA-binding transcriptional MerR regulator
MATERTQELWTIDELGSRVALALSVDYDGQASGRVRDVPDQRTIRYYTTLGLIDRPAALRGRTALYGRRHLLQLVAIKRLQAQGLTLAELQQQLLGQPDAVLEKLARLSVEVVDAAPRPANKKEEAEPARREAAFWCAAPAEVEERPPPAAAPVMQGVPLDAGLTLLFAPQRRLEAGDLEAIQAAAAPLLKLLEKRRLL